MNSEPKKHIIAARNILFGTGYFLILPLPQGWAITQSYLEPDIHSTVRREDIDWVEAGQTDQIVFHPVKKVALDLMIQIKRGQHDNLDTKGLQIFAQGKEVIGGHPAVYCLGEGQQGFIKKKAVKTLRFCFYCPELNHTVFLYFTGKCHDADLREIFAFSRLLECH